MGVFNHIVHHFYLISALSLLTGCLVVGFFLGLDMALARERDGIQEALEKHRNVHPPKKYYPMTRRFSVVAFCSSLFVCLILALVISRDFAWLAEVQSNAAMLKEAERTVMLEVVFIMAALLGMVVNLIFSYSRNLKLLFNNETRILENVSRGDLSRMVPVATWDEFGVIAGHTNTMIEGLRQIAGLHEPIGAITDLNYRPSGSQVGGMRVPLGVCVGLGAWNYPTQVAGWKAAPALVCCNTMVYKPSEQTRLSALKPAEILIENGGVYTAIARDPVPGSMEFGLIVLVDELIEAL